MSAAESNTGSAPSTGAVAVAVSSTDAQRIVVGMQRKSKSRGSSLDRGSSKRSRSGCGTRTVSGNSHPQLGFEGMDGCLRSIVHHPFGLPLTWFLNKDLIASGNDGDGDENAGDDKPAAAQRGGGTPDQDCAPGGGGADAAEVEENGDSTTTTEATATAILIRNEEIMDLPPCLLTASTSSTSDSDIALLRGIEASSSEEEMASATGVLAAATSTQASSPKAFKPVTGGGDGQGDMCPRRDRTNGSAVSPSATTACGGCADEEAVTFPSEDEETEAVQKVSPTIQTMFQSIVAKIEEVAAEMPTPGGVDAVLQESYDTWLALGLEWTDTRKRTDENNKQPKPGEPKLTKLLCNEMKKRMSSPDLEVIHQERLKPQDEDGAEISTGHPDVLVCSKAGEDSAAHACLMVEVGFGDTHHARWKKVHQLRQYEHILQRGTNRVRLKSRPMLLATLTINKGGNDSFDFESGSMAVFLVTPKDEDGRRGSRVCLLTRTTAETLDVLSAFLGQVLRAAVALPRLDDDLKGFEYLGPNACRIGDKVCGLRRNVVILLFC